MTFGPGVSVLSWAQKYINQFSSPLDPKTETQQKQANTNSLKNTKSLCKDVYPYKNRKILKLYITKRIKITTTKRNKKLQN